MASIIVVDDEDSVRTLLHRRLTSEGHNVATFATPDDAMRAINTRQPDLVVMDVAREGTDGYEACRRLQGEFPNLPVVFVTASSDIDGKATALEAGERDYIARPFAATELVARVKAALREKAHVEPVERRSEASEDLAIFDALTGVANRRYLDARLPEEILRAKRYGRSLSVLMIDIDDFKQINDKEGRQAGDRVIAELARILKTRVREVDFVARYGGEEFVVMLPETPLEGALVVARRLCERIAALPVATHKVTISIGVATGHSADVLARADAAMYRAKRAGKNRAWPWETGESLPGSRG